MPQFPEKNTTVPRLACVFADEGNRKVDTGVVTVPPDIMENSISFSQNLVHLWERRWQMVGKPSQFKLTLKFTESDVQIIMAHNMGNNYIAYSQDTRAGIPGQNMGKDDYIKNIVDFIATNYASDGWRAVNQGDIPANI